MIFSRDSSLRFISFHDLCLIVLLTFVGIVTHLVPHNMGITTVGAISMLSAAYLPKRWCVVPMFLTVYVSDVISGGYALVAMTFVYLGHLAAAISLLPLLNKITRNSVILAAVLNAVVFYLLSNITPMVMGYYPASVEGWTLCYVNAIPFLLKAIVANLTFGGIGFGIVYLMGQQRAHRITAS